LDNDAVIHLGFVQKGSTYLAIVQKYNHKNWAAVLLFGYDSDPKFMRKSGGNWNSMKAISLTNIS
jgi:hypothetical protein